MSTCASAPSSNRFLPGSDLKIKSVSRDYLLLICSEHVNVAGGPRFEEKTMLGLIKHRLTAICAASLAIEYSRLNTVGIHIQRISDEVQPTWKIETAPHGRHGGDVFTFHEG